ncbi:MAG: PD40 domain-containing protein [Bacteroidetes bacterium]|nr:PD40 domain-containing protein [Bacteroidota bacterium]
MKIRLLFLLLCCSFSVLSAQDIDLGNGYRRDRGAQIRFAKAEEYFGQGFYLEALPHYRVLENKYAASPLLLYRIGVCLLYKSDEVLRALDYLTQVKAKNPKAADIDFYLARAYHLNGRYDEALISLDAFSKQKRIDPVRRADADRLRRYCNSAKVLIQKPVDATILNLQSPVNSSGWEYVPVVTSDDSLLIFTYRGPLSRGGLQRYPGVKDSTGEYFEDVFYSRRNSYTGAWSTPEAFDTLINSNGHDAAIAGSNDGQQLLIYRATPEDNGDIFISSLFGKTWSFPEPLYGEVNTYSWEGSASLSPDGRTLYFASERPGGYGGRDLWMAELQPDGSWGNVVNLGPNINTADNEDAPFIHPNGTSLVFSSEGHNSMGGYDIFVAEFNVAANSFSESTNIGFPINTAGDDKYFVITPDGKHGYYSSGRPGGLGNQDIYNVEIKQGSLLGNVVMIAGVITLDGQPVRGNVTIKSDSTVLSKFYVQSNSESGRYLLNLPLGHRYELYYEIAGVERMVKVVDTRTITEYTVVQQDAAFVTAVSLAGASKAAADTLLDYNGILAKYGSTEAQGLLFRVQIAAYAYPQNYRNGKLAEFGKPDNVKLDDGITRFTLGSFKTLAEAEAYRKQLIAAGASDAFVTAERFTKRYLLSELVKNDFFRK